MAAIATGQQHAPVATATALVAETAPAGAAGMHRFSARVAPAPQDADDRGTVTFLEILSDGQVRSLGAALVAADGTASLAVRDLPEGAHRVNAVYSGSASAATSTSKAADVTAQATVLPSFSLTAAPTTLNVDAGAQTTVAVTVSPANGFNNYVSLSCAGLPLYTTCTFLPSNVPVTGTVGGSTMTLNTTAPSGHTTSLHRSTGLVYAFLLPGLLGLAGLGFGRHRGLRMLALLCVAGSLIGGASSCAQRYRYLNYGPTDNPGTPNGQSIIRIYGTAVNGAVSTIQCFQITLNVTSTNTSGSSGNITTPCS